MEPLLSQAPFPLSPPFPTTHSIYIGLSGAWWRLTTCFPALCFFTATTHAFPTVLLTSNQLFTKGTFNPPNYTRQLPSLPTQALSKPTAFFNYTIAAPPPLVAKHPINTINHHSLVHTQHFAAPAGQQTSSYIIITWCTHNSAHSINNSFQYGYPALHTITWQDLIFNQCSVTSSVSVGRQKLDCQPTAVHGQNCCK